MTQNFKERTAENLDIVKWQVNIEKNVRVAWTIFRCQGISAYGISTAANSTAAISTVHTFNRSIFQPHAISTAWNFNHRKFNRFNYRVIN